MLRILGKEGPALGENLTKSIVCPNCGECVPIVLHTGIQGDISAEEKEKILQETFFSWKCPACGCISQLLYPCLYSDRRYGYMLYFLPPGASFPQWEEASEQEKVRKRIVSSPEEFREKILIFENGLDDRAVELVKYAMVQVLSRQSGVEIRSGVYLESDPEKDRMDFLFLPEGSEKALRRTTKFTMYEKVREVARQFAPAETGFLRMDQKAAAQIMERYARG